MRVCAFMFLMVVTPDCQFDPISLVLAQRNGVEPPKKSAFWRETVPNPRCSLRFSARKRLPCPSGGHVRPRAQSARLKVSSTFSKVVESRGKASGRAPQSAKLSFCSKKIRKGVQGGTLAGGSPFYFSLTRVRRYVSRDFDLGVPFRPHFFGPCPKKRCRAAKERRFFP